MKIKITQEQNITLEIFLFITDIERVYICQ